MRRTKKPQETGKDYYRSYRKNVYYLQELRSLRNTVIEKSFSNVYISNTTSNTTQNSGVYSQSLTDFTNNLEWTVTSSNANGLFAIL